LNNNVSASQTEYWSICSCCRFRLACFATRQDEKGLLHVPSIVVSKVTSNTIIGSSCGSSTSLAHASFEFY
jgi:hypothetical protein